MSGDLGQSVWRAGQVLLHPDDVRVVYVEGQLVGYAVNRELIGPTVLSAPEPGSLVKVSGKQYQRDNEVLDEEDWRS